VVICLLCFDVGLSAFYLQIKEKKEKKEKSLISWSMSWSETTLNYRMMVERYPNLKEEVGSSIHDYEISSLPDGKLPRWSSTSCALTLACRPSIFFKEKRKKKRSECLMSWSTWFSGYGGRHQILIGSLRHRLSQCFVLNTS
jgi:hypothetical protein